MLRPDPTAPEHRFDVLHAAHHAAVLRYFARRVGREHAADLTAEVFLVAWRRLDAVPRDDALPWLYAVARNVLANDRRARGRRDELPGRLAHQGLEHARDPATVVAERDLLRGALLALRDADRQLLMLIAWDGLTAEQAGRILGCRTPVVHVRLHRARKRLSEQLERATAVRAVAAVAIALVVAVAAFSVLGSTGGTGPDRARAGAITALASRAGDVPAFAAPTADRPYAYVRQRITGPTVVHLASGRLVPARYRQEIESWQRADGRGRRRVVDAPLTFADPRDAETVASLKPARQRTTVREAALSADDARQATNGIGRPLALSPDEIAAFPDEESALADVLARAAERASATATRPAAGQLAPAQTVTDLAADLLSLQAVRPTVRAALVRVIGRDAGVSAHPGMRDPTGRSGTGLQWRSTEGHRTVLLIDPTTTRVLAQRTSIPDSGAGRPTDDGSEPTIDVWTTILAAGATAEVGDRP